jgi:hypothetical protein
MADEVEALRGQFVVEIGVRQAWPFEQPLDLVRVRKQFAPQVERAGPASLDEQLVADRVVTVRSRRVATRASGDGGAQREDRVAAREVAAAGKAGRTCQRDLDARRSWNTAAPTRTVASA